MPKRTLSTRMPAAILTVLATLAACADTATSPSVNGPELTIQDAAHNDGNEHFFWLPPMVSNPGSFNGPFDDAQSPVVRICDLADCMGMIVAEFTMDTGPGSATVRVEAVEEHYIVNWHTNEYAVEPGPTYRIAVLLGDTEIGLADVQLGSTGKEVKNLTTDDIIGLKDGRTLPIKFRIEEGAVEPLPAWCGTEVDFDGGVIPNGWVFVPRSRAGSLSPQTGLINDRLQAASTDDDALVGTELLSSGVLSSVTIEWDGNIPIAPSGTGHNLYVVGGGQTVQLQYGYASGAGHNWYGVLWDMEGTIPSTPNTPQLSGPNSVFSQTVYDSQSTDQEYHVVATFTDGQVEWTLTRLGSGAFVDTRTDALPGFTLASLTGIYTQVYHTSPGTLWQDNFSISCQG